MKQLVSSALIVLFCLLFVPQTMAGDIFNQIQGDDSSSLKVDSLFSTVSTDAETDTTTRELFNESVYVPQGNIEWTQEIDVQAKSSLVSTSTFFKGMGGKIKTGKFIEDDSVGPDGCSFKGVGSSFSGLSTNQESVASIGSNGPLFGMAFDDDGTRTFNVVEVERTEFDVRNMSHFVTAEGKIKGEIGYKNDETPASIAGEVDGMEWNKQNFWDDLPTSEVPSICPFSGNAGNGDAVIPLP